MVAHRLKPMLSAGIAAVVRPLAAVEESLRKIVAHGCLASRLKTPLPASVVVLGRSRVYGTGDIRFGERALLYPDLHLETQQRATVVLGNGVVLSRGVHLVAMAGISIGDGTMIGEYASVRDANHARQPGLAIRDAGHAAKPIHIGKEVWIGRGVAILAGVSIGDGATIGANAVVTRDVPEGATFGGVPARELKTKGEARGQREEG